ncbi:type II and III secretion system protein family protein [Photobacterium sagamiensis]|uniref:type II and III secretion system protein family protein n=1 Tax=Photobacterium sagamiensis TaxID=2910241 RepID=UPI003D0DEC70
MDRPLTSKFDFSRLISILILLLGLGISSNTFAARTESITVPQNKSRLVEIPGRAKKISVGNPTVADILILRSNKIYVLGKALGTTNVIIWDSKDRLISVLDVEVTHDLNALKTKLYEFMPSEKVSVYSSQNKLVLSGEVSSAAKVDTAVQIANTFSSNEAGIINLMTVGGSHQIMLEVTVAEVRRTLVREFDSNFVFARNSGNWTWGGANGGVGVDPTSGDFLTGLNIEDTGLFASFMTGNTLFATALNIAKTNGLAKVLAEPTLTALSGEQAEFLSGGEFPIPVPNEDGITVEFKEFGVGLKFIPTVMSADSINLALNIEVSEVTTENATAISTIGTSSQFFVPSLKKRSVKTTVELGNGQTIGIAGLLSENISDAVDKLPGLGDLPVIGQLFRSQQFQKGETELVILVTPRLAKPVRQQDITLPTDSFVEPNDWEFYLLGRMSELKHEGASGNNFSQDSATSTYNISPDAGSEGQFGHSL